MIYFIYFLIVVAFVDTFSQLPIMSPYAEELGASALMIGIIVGMYSFTNIAGNILAGFYIDQRGVKRILAAGLLSTGIILTLYALVTSPVPLLVVRFFHGLTGGLLVPAAFTYLANHRSVKQKGKVMAQSGAGVGLASIIGPAFGGIISSAYSADVVFVSIGLLMIVTSILAFLLLPDKGRDNSNINSGKSAKTAYKTSETSTANVSGFFELFKRQGLLLSYIGAFSLMFSQGIIAYALPLRVEELGFDGSLSGILLSTFAIVATLIFVLPTNRLYDRLPYAPTMMTGIAILAVSLAFLEFVSLKGLMFTVMGIYGIGFALIFPSMTALVATHASTAERGKAYGVFYGFFSLGVVAGSFVTGLFAETGLGVFLVGTIALLIAVFGMSVAYKKSSRPIK